MAEGRHIVLVHGAWQGSWAFDAWLPHLRRHGWQPHAVDLPGNGWPPNADAPAGLEAYTDHVAGVLRRIGAPAVVLGHSGGGITASQVAEALPDQVTALVYLAGMMLPSGVTYVDIVRQCAADHPDTDFSGVGPALQWNADRSASSVPQAAALRCFLHDCPPDAALHAAGLLRPQPEAGRAMANRLTAERFGRVPRVYVECGDDRSLLPVVQRRMQQLTPGATRLAFAAGHVPQLAQPLRLADQLCPLLDAVAADRPDSPSLSPSRSTA